MAALAGFSKFVLLGTKDAGKSTLVRSAKNLFGEGFSPQELRDWIPTIQANALTAIHTLLEQTRDNPVSAAHIALVPIVLSATLPLSVDVAKAISTLWIDEGIQAAYARRCEYQLQDSASYFLTKVRAVAAADYTPTPTDVLRAHVKNGLSDITVSVPPMAAVTIWDTVGSRDERDKYVAVVDNVKVVLFVVSLAEYDLKLSEDDSVNRVTESMAMFESVISAPWFARQSPRLFLVLNKRDIFIEKLRVRPISVCPEYAEYKGANTEAASINFIKLKFGVRAGGLPFETIVTNAADAMAAFRVFDTVVASITPAPGKK